MITLLTGDVRAVLPTLPSNSVQCVVSSPPYYGLRDYGTAQWEGGDVGCEHIAPATGPTQNKGNNGKFGAPYREQCRCGARRIDAQLGLEPTPDAYIATMVEVFRELRRVLRDDGTCWVNMGDSYAGSWSGNSLRPDGGEQRDGGPGFQPLHDGRYPKRNGNTYGAKPKDLLMMPARLALALQADGWWLRSDIIWSKPNPMPESCRDRPTSAHEHVFLFTKRAKYYYDNDAVREPHADWREGSNTTKPQVMGQTIATEELRNRWNPKENNYNPARRNLRNVWTIATAPFPAAHFATFPPELAERCIRAGSRPGDTILDPFSGAGTALLVADRLGRDSVGIDLNHAYVEMARERLQRDCPLFAEINNAPIPEPPEDERMADLFAEDEYQRLPPVSPKLHVPTGWDTRPGAHGTIHRNGRTIVEAAE